MKGEVRRYRRGTIATGIVVGAVAVTVAIGAAAVQLAGASRVLRTVLLRGQASAVAIDESARRAVVIGSDNGTGYASTLDTATGALVRTVTIGSNPTDVAVDERTGRVFITDIVDGTVSVLDAQSGALLRTVVVGGMQPHNVQRIVIDPRTDRVFVSIAPVSSPYAVNSAVRMLDARSGTLLQTTRAGGGSLAVDERSGQVLVANLPSNSISMLDGRTGAWVRTVALGAGTGALHLAVDGRTGNGFALTDTGLLTFDARTGRLLRAFPLPGSNGVLQVDEAHDRVVAVAASSAPPNRTYLHLLDARTGTVVHTTAAPDAYLMALDRRRGSVIIGTARAVSAIDVRTGIPLWTFAGSMHTLVNLAVEERTGHVIAVDGGAMDTSGTSIGAGSVVVLDGRTGAMQSVTSVGVSARSLALDEQTGHAIVVNHGGAVRVSDTWGWIPTWLRQRLPFFPRPQGTRIVSGSVSVLDAVR